MNINPSIEKKLKNLCGENQSLFECLKELLYFELISQRDYTSVYEQFISQYAKEGCDYEDN
jgi:hypothetical protein